MSRMQRDAHRGASTTSSSSSPTSTARARPRPTNCSPRPSCAWACRSARATSSRRNIQGLPTWYEVRVSEAGWLGRRGGVDLMVAMNPQTWDADVAEIEPGGYLLLRQHASRCRRRGSATTCTSIGVPLTEICNARLQRPAPAPAVQEHRVRRRAGGAAGHRPDGDREAVRRAVQGQGEAARSRTCGACTSAATARASTSTMPLGLRVRARRCGRRPHLRRGQHRRRARLRVRRRHRLRLVSDHAVVVARRGVPEVLPEAARRQGDRQEQVRDLQAEDEIASIGMVVGAGWNGARAFTATSGPGVSLMTEFIGLAYFAEIPVDDHRRAARRPVDRHAGRRHAVDARR